MLVAFCRQRISFNEGSTLDKWPKLNQEILDRRIEDEMSYWLGPVFAKFLKIFVNLMMSIHFFSCAYWRVKVRELTRGVACQDALSHFVVIFLSLLWSYLWLSLKLCMWSVVTSDNLSLWVCATVPRAGVNFLGFRFYWRGAKKITEIIYFFLSYTSAVGNGCIRHFLVPHFKRRCRKRNCQILKYCIRLVTG